MRDRSVVAGGARAATLDRCECSPPAAEQAVSASPAATTARSRARSARLLEPGHTGPTRVLAWSSTSGQSTGAPPARDLRRREPGRNRSPARRRLGGRLAQRGWAIMTTTAARKHTETADAPHCKDRQERPELLQARAPALPVAARRLRRARSGSFARPASTRPLATAAASDPAAEADPRPRLRHGGAVPGPQQRGAEQRGQQASERSAQFVPGRKYRRRPGSSPGLGRRPGAGRIGARDADRAEADHRAQHVRPTSRS